MQTYTTQVPSTPPIHIASDPVIPAVRGKFYSYSSLFTVDRPFGFLMHCKANKSRPISDVADYATEHDLTFVFTGGVSVCSPNAAQSVRMLDGLIGADRLNETSVIARLDIVEDVFYELRQKGDGRALAEVCCQMAPRDNNAVALATGTVFAVVTKSGKYGLFLVKELTPTSAGLDAAHILL